MYWSRIFAVAGVVVGLVGSASVADAQSSVDLPLLWYEGGTGGWGWEAAPVGDIDGDGYDDAVVWPTKQSAGAGVGVFRGSPVGLEDSLSQSLPSPTTTTSGGRFGHSIEGAGDVNGDGYADVIIGDPNGENPNSGPKLGSGRAYVYYGSDSGLSKTPNWTGQVPPGGRQSRFGDSVAGVGDVNGDGFDDVLIGDPNWQSLLECLQAQHGASSGHGGEVFLYLGSSSGLSSSPAWSYSWENSPSQRGACLGYTVSGLGDVNGDGYADLAVTAPAWANPRGHTVGKVLVFYGSSSGLSQSPDWQRAHPGLSADQPSSATKSEDLRGVFGWSIDGKGDTDGDGYDELLIGGRGYYQTETGPTDWKNSVVLFDGSAQGLSDQPVWSVQMTGGYLHWRNSDITINGDVNGDGYSDIVVPANTSQISDFNQLALYLGSSSGPSATPAWTLDYTDFGLQPASHWLLSVENAIRLGGDFDGDGRDDLLAHVQRAATSSANNFISGLHVFTGGPNPKPTAQSERISVPKGDSTSVSFQATDPYGDPLMFSIRMSPTKGSLDGFDPTQGTVTYWAPAGYVGSDSFEYEVVDDHGRTDSATIDVTVTNAAPVFEQPPAGSNYTTTVGEQVSFPIDISEPDGDPVTRSARLYPDGANIAWDGEDEPGEFRWTPGGDQTGDHTVTLVADDTFEEVTRTVTISVRPLDSDGDGIPDSDDACPNRTADTADGCPPVAEPDPMADVGSDAAQPAGAKSSSTQSDGCGCASSTSRPAVPISRLIVIALVAWLAIPRERSAQINPSR